MDRRILKIFLLRFRIQSEIFTPDLLICQWQRIADSTIFWARILEFACLKNILLVFRIQREISSANLKINHNHPIMTLDHNGSADLHTRIHSLLINIHSRPRWDGNEY